MLPSTPKELETPIFVTFRIKMLSNFTQPLTFRSNDMWGFLSGICRKLWFNFLITHADVWERGTLQAYTVCLKLKCYFIKVKISAPRKKFQSSNRPKKAFMEKIANSFQLSKRLNFFYKSDHRLSRSLKFYEKNKTLYSQKNYFLIFFSQFRKYHSNFFRHDYTIIFAEKSAPK